MTPTATDKKPNKHKQMKAAVKVVLLWDTLNRNLIKPPPL